jgi:hypothetical protein
MSIHIFNGYILPSTSLNNLKKLCSNLKESMHDIHIKISHEKFAEKCCDLIDQNMFGIHHGNYTVRKKKVVKTHFVPYIETFKKISQRQQDYQKKYHDLNFEFNITFIPSNKNILALVDGNYSEEYLTFFEDLPNVKEYQYWNTSVKPSNITAKEWKQRYNTWNKALNNSPIESGFNIMILSNNISFDSHNIIKYQPSIEHRLKTSIENLAIQEEMEKEENNSMTINESIIKYLNVKHAVRNGLISVDKYHKKFKFDLKRLDEKNLIEKIEINSKLALNN